MQKRNNIMLHFHGAIEGNQCVATPILANTPLGEEDRATNVVKTPEPFNSWVRENRERVSQAATRETIPWFILENEKYFDMVY